MVPDQGSAGSVSAGLCSQRCVGEGRQSDGLLAPGAAREPEGCGSDEDLHNPQGLRRPGTHGHGKHPGCSSMWINRNRMMDGQLVD